MKTEILLELRFSAVGECDETASPDETALLPSRPTAGLVSPSVVPNCM